MAQPDEAATWCRVIVHRVVIRGALVFTVIVRRNIVDHIERLVLNSGLNTPSMHILVKPEQLRNRHVSALDGWPMLRQPMHDHRQKKTHQQSCPDTHG